MSRQFRTRDQCIAGQWANQSSPLPVAAVAWHEGRRCGIKEGWGVLRMQIPRLVSPQWGRLQTARNDKVMGEDYVYGF